MKKYFIDVHGYPETFEINAGSEEEAKKIATELFYKKRNSAIYEIDVTGTQDVQPTACIICLGDVVDGKEICSDCEKWIEKRKAYIKGELKKIKQ